MVVFALVVGAKQGASLDGPGRTDAYFSVRGSPYVTGATGKSACADTEAVIASMNITNT